MASSSTTMASVFTPNSYLKLMVRRMSRNDIMHKYLGIQVHYINRQHHREEGALRAATLGIRKDRFSVDHRQTHIMDLNRELILLHGNTIISIIVGNPGLLNLSIPFDDEDVRIIMNDKDHKMCCRLGLLRCLQITLKYLIRHQARINGSRIEYF